MAEPDSKNATVRAAARWGFLLAGIGTVLWRTPKLWAALQSWRGSLAGGDASVSDTYRTFFFADAAGASIVLAIAVVLFWLLSPRKKSEAHGARR